MTNVCGIKRRSGQQTCDGLVSQQRRLRGIHAWQIVRQKVIPVAAGVSTPPARTRLEFAYDYKNRRIAKKVFVEESGTDLQPVVWRLTKDLRFVYDGWHMIAELDATFATGTGVAGITPARGVVRTYLWGPDVSGTMTGAGGVGGLLAFTFQGDSYYPISDANGNITAIHAPGIDQVIRFDYDPFGNRLTNTGPDVEICPMGFSSKYTDSETGLVYYGFRYFSPMMGRWLSRDPIEERGGVNLYGFVGNDPVNQVDLLGLFPETPADLMPIQGTLIVFALAELFRMQGDTLGAAGLMHYYYRTGVPLKLTRNDFKMVEIMPEVNIMGHQKVAKAAFQILGKKENRIEVSDLTGGYQVTGRNGNNLLGNFSISMTATVSCDPSGYKVEGTFKVVDRYDFDPKWSDTLQGRSGRSPEGIGRTIFGWGNIPGKPYDVTSDAIPFTQKATDYRAKW
jgi:RHS repeat-associated protein